MPPWVRTPEELAALGARLQRTRAMGLDSESDSLHHYREKVCLVQIASSEGEAVLVDPLRLPALGPLKPALADPGIRKVLHGADYDVLCLRRDFGFAFAGLFDTMIAARFLGRAEVGLQAVARDELGVALSKAHQRDDWSRRPLTPAQEAYALADVRHLVELGDRLAARLRALGRLAWVEEECAAVAALEPAPATGEKEPFRRVKGSAGLGPRSLAVLRALWQWREEVAARRDVPAFKVVTPDTLLALASRPPRRVEDLASARGVLPRFRAQADEILARVASALGLPEEELPRVTRTPRPFVPPETRRRIEALRRWRSAKAAELGLDVSVVLPQRLLEKVAEAAPAEAEGLAAVEGLRRWRVETFAGELLATLSRPAPPPT
jgi:ribonuclease D